MAARKRGRRGHGAPEGDGSLHVGVPESQLPAAIAALVALGPAVQPWYLLWALPLFAASGLSRNQVREVITVVALFTLHGIANSAATADTFIEFSDGVAILLAAVILGLVVASSHRERELILDAEAMTPRSDQQRTAAASAVLA